MIAITVTAGYLFIIYQRSWESGEIPADWNVIQIKQGGSVKRSRRVQTCYSTQFLEKLWRRSYWVLWFKLGWQLSSIPPGIEGNKT